MSRARPGLKATQHKLQSVAEGLLAGRVFCFIGRREGMARAEAEGEAKACGAVTADSITKKVTDVVVGKEAGSERAKAFEMRLEVHDQEGSPRGSASRARAARHADRNTVAPSVRPRSATRRVPAADGAAVAFATPVPRGIDLALRFSLLLTLLGLLLAKSPRSEP